MTLYEALADIIRRISVYTIVDVSETGLHFRNGRYVERHIKGFEEETKKEKLEEILKREAEVYLQAGGLPAFLPFRRPELPKGFRLSKVSNTPRSDDRYDANLRPGGYWTFPVIDWIRTELIHEERTYTGMIPILTHDSRNVLVGWSVWWELLNFAKAYANVKHYGPMLAKQTLVDGEKVCRERDFIDFTDKEKLEKMEDLTLEKVRKVATEKWGLKIHSTDMIVRCEGDVRKVFYEGPPPILYNGDGSTERMPPF